MADQPRLDAAWQVLQHIERFRIAGVEFAPAPDWANPVPQSTTAETTNPSAAVASAGADPRVELAVLAEEVRKCTRCPELASTRTQTVFGVGPLHPELCFVGEAPGADEDRQGEPFVGAAGQLLNRIISACGMKREEVYICNILRCRPPGNRPPKPDEAANCRTHLERTLEIVAPKFICCLGASAANYLLLKNQSIGSMRSKFFDYRGIPVVCTYHPSYLLRTGSVDDKRKVWDDMKTLLTRMGRPIPEPKK